MKTDASSKLYRLVFYLLLASVLLSFSLRAQARPAATGGSTSSNDMALKTIIVDNYAPYTFVNAPGQPDGFSAGFNLEPVLLQKGNTALKDLGWVVLGSLIGGIALLFWSFSLRRQVAARTKSLELEIRERKQAEEALRESDERLALAQRSAGAGVWDWDMVTGKLNWSPELFHLFGLDPAKVEATFEVWGSVLHPDDRKIAGERIDAAIRDHTPLFNEYRIITPSGETRWINAWGDTTYNEHGEARRMNGICIDVTGRKQAEKVLRESEEKLRRSALDLKEAQGVAHIGSWKWDLKNGEVYWSDEMYRIFGIDKNSYTGRLGDAIAQAIHPDDLHLVLPSNASTFAGKKPVEYRIILPDQSVRHIWAKAGATILDENGNSIFLTGIAQDITERKQVEEALRENEANLSALIENTDGSIWAIDQHYGLVVGNQEFHRNTSARLGRRLEKGESVLLPAFPADANAEWRGYYDRALQGERFSVETVTRFRATPRSIEYRFTPIGAENGGIRGVTVYGRDITERKRAEETLRESEDKFKYVFDYSMVGKSITSPDGEVHTNKAFCDMLGYSVAEMQGRKWQDVTHPEDIKLTQDAIDLLVSGQQESARFVKRFIRKNGAIIWADLSSSIRRDKQNQPLYLMTSVIDITERKVMEENLQKTTTLLEQSFEQSPIPMILVSMPDMVLRIVNPACREFLGIADEPSYVGTSLFDYKATFQDFNFNGTLGALENLPLARSLRGERTLNEERRIVRKDGSTRWELVSGVPIHNAQGEMIAGYLVLIDITERKLVEEALAKSEAMLQRVQEVAHMGSWEIDLATKTVTASAEAHRIYGVPLGDLTLDYVQSVPLPEFRPTLDAALAALIREGKRYDVEFKIRRGDVGEVRDVHSIAEYNAAHRTIVGAIQDITERKQAEEALRQSEALYRQAIEVAGAVPYLQTYAPTSSDVYYTFIGEGIRQITGYGPEEFTEKIWDTLVQESVLLGDLAGYAWQEAIDQVRFGDNAIWKCEHRIRARDGQIHWVFESAVELRDEHGVSRGSIGLFQDITARKQAEDALRESEALYHDLVETSQDLIWQCDAEGRYTYLNPAWEQVFGYKLEEMLGKKFTDFQTPEAAARDQAEFARLMRGNTVKGLESTHIGKSGHEIQLVFNAKFLADENGQIIGTHGTAYDITERKRAEQALRKSENLYRKMNENSPLGMHFYRLNSRGQLIFVDANPAADKLLGVENAQFIGKTIEEAFPPLAQTEVPERYGAAAAHGISWSTEQIAYDDQRIAGAFEVRAFQTTPGHMVAVFADITARKQAEEEITQLNASLEQRVRERTLQLETSNKELEAFSYSISHDLRAPLRGIDGWSMALLEDYGDQLDEQAHQYLDRVRSETQRLGRLIDDILQLSRLTRAEMRKERVDLSDLAQTLAARLQESEPERPVEFDIQPGLSASGDPRLLEAALANLLGNAFKFTGKTPRARIAFGQTEIQGEPVFFVRDNGAGFDMTYSQKLFGAFQRMHKVSEFPGTGIGLATVQRIIHRHGGRVWVEAAVNQGATFYFTLG